MTSVITMPLDPALQIGPIPLHWYGLGYAIAFLVGVRLITPFLQHRGIPPGTTSELVWWNIGMGLLGARLYFDIQQPDLSVFVREPIRIIAVWEGGMAFFGALIACGLALRWRRMSPAVGRHTARHLGREASLSRQTPIHAARSN